MTVKTQAKYENYVFWGAELHFSVFCATYLASYPLVCAIEHADTVVLIPTIFIFNKHVHNLWETLNS